MKGLKPAVFLSTRPAALVFAEITEGEAGSPGLSTTRSSLWIADDGGMIEVEIANPGDFGEIGDGEGADAGEELLNWEAAATAQRTRKGAKNMEKVSFWLKKRGAGVRSGCSRHER